MVGLYSQIQFRKKDGGNVMVTGGELTSKNWRRDSLLGEDCGTDHEP